MDSRAKTGIWPYDCMSVCNGCDGKTNVWLRIPSTLWATIIPVIAGVICISFGTRLPTLAAQYKIFTRIEENSFLAKQCCWCTKGQTETKQWALLLIFDSCIDYTDTGYEYAELELPLPPRPAPICQRCQSMSDGCETIDTYNIINLIFIRWFVAVLLICSFHCWLLCYLSSVSV